MGEYELYDEEFRKYLRKISKEIRSDEVKSSLKGLPYAFCFKDIHQDMKILAIYRVLINEEFYMVQQVLESLI